MEKEWQPLPPPKVTRWELHDKYEALMSLSSERRDKVVTQAIIRMLRHGECKMYDPESGKLTDDKKRISAFLLSMGQDVAEDFCKTESSEKPKTKKRKTKKEQS